MADAPKPKKLIEVDTALKVALDNPDIPKIYANSFGVGMTNADMFIVFQRFGPYPVGVVNLSYTLAKTLAQRLGTLISEFESSIAGQNILTTDRIDEAMKERGEASKPVEKSDEIH
jgi:hypothetical protein